MLNMAGELDIAERVRLAKARTTLNYYEDEFIKAVKNLGQLLRRLRDDPEKPFLLDYPSFEAYVEVRLGIGRRQANYLIAGEFTRDHLALNAPADVAPVVAKMNERQLHEIAKVDPPQQIEVLRDALKANPKLTAKGIREAKGRIIDGETGKPEPARHCPTCGRRMQP